MKVTFNASSSMTAEIEGDSEVELFKNIAKFQETFSHECCGVCKNTKLKFVVRSDKEENEYFELWCTDSKCRAKLAFGQTKKGFELFPKRHANSLSEKDKENRGVKEGYLPNDGWYIWKKGN